MTASDTENVPVITIDGPSGSGKGTVSRIVAQTLGFYFLDSGALYRLTALAARHHAIALDDEDGLKTLAEHLDVQFKHDPTLDDVEIILEGEAVTSQLRTESCGRDASVVAAIPAVRQALLARQRAFQRPPGLVADGRDMGTVVFPHARLKIFLDASRLERAKRRHNQLRAKGIDVSIERLLEELEARDRRDSSRSVAPMMAADDAVHVDTTQLDIDAVVETILALWQKKSQ
jgi:cytidylate kinase